MKKWMAGLLLGLGVVGLSLAETDYTVSRDVQLVKRDVAVLQTGVVMRATGVTTSFYNIFEGFTNLVSIEDGQVISISPY